MAPQQAASVGYVASAAHPGLQIRAGDPPIGSMVGANLLARILQVPDLARRIGAWLQVCHRRGEAWLLGQLSVIWRRDWGYRQLSLLYLWERDLRLAQW